MVVGHFGCGGNLGERGFFGTTEERADPKGSVTKIKRRREVVSGEDYAFTGRLLVGSNWEVGFWSARGQRAEGLNQIPNDHGVAWRWRWNAKRRRRWWARETTRNRKKGPLW